MYERASKESLNIWTQIAWIHHILHSETTTRRKPSLKNLKIPSLLVCPWINEVKWKNSGTVEWGLFIIHHPKLMPC